jgi:phospholipase C
VGAGQELVLLLYNALASGPLWDKTLLLIVYDEHGGFHDHVAPPEALDDDPAKFGRYGVRVPALGVSPWIAPRSVAGTLFDHTSIIKTILTRFAPAELERRSGASGLLHWLEEGDPHYMGKRVANAEHLGALLSEPAPRPAPDRSALIAWLAARHAGRAQKLAGAPVSFPAEQRLFTDLQRSTLGAAKYLHDQGHPPGQP